ncbi:MAG: lysylphosphatidylglycerol synthase transmembrane domain-containing protein [Acidimicrobiales bacterium]
MIPGSKTVPGPKGSWSVRWSKVRPYARVVFAIAAIALGWWVLSGHTAELAGASAYLTHIKWEWVVIAVAAEFGSIVAYAIVQQRLIAAGGLHTGLGWLTGVTLANIAITNSLPTGSIIATIFTYRQYRHKGADEVLAAWAIVALLVVTSVTLAVVAATGVGIAGSESSNLDLVGVTIGVLVLTLAVGALFVQRRALVWALSRSVALVRRVFPRWGARADAIVKQFVHRLNSVSQTPLQMVVCMTWGLVNWMLDCGCLVISFTALGVGVPWRGLVLAYGAGQLAANLPITPGGLGVVEGSLTVALVAYGGAETSTVAAVFLYRLISFWGELPVGWIAWAWLAARRRRTRAGLGGGLPEVPVPYPQKVGAR